MDVVICGWDEVRSWLFDWDFDHIISIGAPGVGLPEALAPDDPRVLRLEFCDTHAFDDAADDGPQPEHAEVLVDACRAIIASGGSTLIHCAQGVSRSSACALTLLAMAYGPGREEDAAADLSRLPGGHRARPNTMLLSHVDELLEREGALYAASASRYHADG